MQPHSEVLEAKAPTCDFWGKRIQPITIGVLIRRGDTQTEDNHVKMETEIGVKQPQVEECLGLLGLKKTKKDPPLEAGESVAMPTL